MIYCPYLDKEVEASTTTPEHIFPLSLGGTNLFCVQVDRDFNSCVGSTLDGVIANDTLVRFRRMHFNAVGHSKTPPVVSLPKSEILKSGRRVHATFPRTGPIQFYDPIARKSLDPGHEKTIKFKTTFKLAFQERLQFSAKVCLSGGYYIYGDYFRNNVRHSDLRTIMNSIIKLTKEEADQIGTRIYTEFSQPTTQDNEEFQIQKALCHFANGSCLITVPGVSNIGFTVGVLGKFMASFNVPADTSRFPHSDANDLGHVVLIQNKQLHRYSYRHFLQNFINSSSDSAL